MNCSWTCLLRGLVKLLQLPKEQCVCMCALRLVQRTTGWVQVFRPYWLLFVIQGVGGTPGNCVWSQKQPNTHCSLFHFHFIHALLWQPAKSCSLSPLFWTQKAAKQKYYNYYFRICVVCVCLVNLENSCTVYIHAWQFHTLSNAHSSSPTSVHGAQCPGVYSRKRVLLNLC